MTEEDNSFERGALSPGAPLSLQIATRAMIGL